MIFPIPNVNVTWNVGGRSKQLDKKEELTKSDDTPPLHMSFQIDPIMLMLATAIVLLSGAMLVYAARS
jgi:hypothetical protein